MPFPDTDFLFRRYQPSAHLLRGVGALKMSLLPFVGLTIPPLPTPSPPFPRGERVGVRGGSYTHVPCPFGALLVTLCQIFSKRFLNGKGDMGGASPHWARPPAGRARPSPLHIKKALASKWS